MHEIDRLSGSTEGIDLTLASESGHPSGSLKSVFGYIRLTYHFRIPSRTAIHNWVQNADLQPTRVERWLQAFAVRWNRAQVDTTGS